MRLIASRSSHRPKRNRPLLPLPDREPAASAGVHGLPSLRRATASPRSYARGLRRLDPKSADCLIEALMRTGAGPEPDSPSQRSVQAASRRRARVRRSNDTTVAVSRFSGGADRNGTASSSRQVLGSGTVADRPTPATSAAPTPAGRQRVRACDAGHGGRYPRSRQPGPPFIAMETKKGPGHTQFAQMASAELLRAHPTIGYGMT